MRGAKEILHTVIYTQPFVGVLHRKDCEGGELCDTVLLRRISSQGQAYKINTNHLYSASI